MIGCAGFNRPIPNSPRSRLCNGSENRSPDMGHELVVVARGKRRGRAEHLAEPGFFLIAADRDAEATGTIGANLLQRFAGVLLRVTSFVVMVIRKSIGDHDQQSTGQAGLRLQHVRGMTQRTTGAGIGSGFELANAFAHA